MAITMNNIRLISIVLAGVFVGCVSALWLFSSSPARGALPTTATDIHEFSAGPSGVTADAWYQLKAKISAQEFDQFVSDMKMTPCPPGQDAEFCAHSGSEKWWDASSDNNGAFVRIHSGSRLERAKYENGYLYYIDSTGY